MSRAVTSAGLLPVCVSPVRKLGNWLTGIKFRVETYQTVTVTTQNPPRICSVACSASSEDSCPYLIASTVSAVVCPLGHVEFCLDVPHLSTGYVA
jgi:hypothetical protein